MARSDTTAYQNANAFFVEEHVVFWGHLSRLTGMLIILNVSLFFLTGLVVEAYYYTFFSVSALCLSMIGMAIPTPLFTRLWYYLCYLGARRRWPLLPGQQCRLLGSVEFLKAINSLARRALA